MEKLKLIGPTGTVTHEIEVSTKVEFGQFSLEARYISGSSAVVPQTPVVAWWASYDPPEKKTNHLGEIVISGKEGRIDLEVESLRGIGLGSVLMRPIITWIKKLPSVPVAPINLAGDDATTQDKMAIRNRFYEKLGFKFDYKDGGLWGESVPMCSANLLVPAYALSRGWQLHPLTLQNSTIF